MLRWGHGHQGVARVSVARESLDVVDPATRICHELRAFRGPKWISVDAEDDVPSRHQRMSSAASGQLNEGRRNEK